MIATPADFDERMPTVPERRWLPWAAMLLVGGTFFLADHDPRVSLADAFTQTVDEMEAEAAGGNLLRRISFPLVGLLGFALLLLPARDRLRIDPVLLTLILAYLGWCSLSVMWSIAPGMAFRRLVILYCVAAAAVGVARHASSRDLMRMGVVVPTVFLAIGVLCELRLGTFRPWAGDYRFSGTLHPNSQGINLACLCISSACLMQTTRRRWWLLASLFAAGFACLLLTKSRTSAAGVLIALTAYWTVTTPLRWKLVLGMCGTWCAAAGALALLLSGVDLEAEIADAALMGREEQAESLTGRLPIWTTIAAFIAERPLLGYGYESFWTAEHIQEVSSELQWGIREAHSMFLDTILAVGVIGLIPAVLAVFVAMLRCQQRYGVARDPVYGMLLAMLVFGLINSFTESAMLMPQFYTFVAGCGMSAMAIRDANGFALATGSEPLAHEPASLLAERLSTPYGNPML